MYRHKNCYIITTELKTNNVYKLKIYYICLMLKDVQSHERSGGYMKEQRDFTGPGDIEQGLRDRLSSNAQAKNQKKRYNRGVAVGLVIIFIPVIAFTLLMVTIPEEPSLLYLAGCGLAVILMAAAIIAVPIRLRKIQAEYFAGTGEEAEEYVSELIEKFKDGQE
jgi:hypothetical protein